MDLLPFLVERREENERRSIEKEDDQIEREEMQSGPGKGCS